MRSWTLAAVALSATVLAGCPIDELPPTDDPDFVATLTGGAEVPPVTTVTTGDVHFFLRDTLDALDFDMRIERATGLFGAAGAHLHCAPAGENGPVVVFLAGEVPGGFDGTVAVRAAITEANIVNDACGATLLELLDHIDMGRVYVNVHSEDHPAGVVRGQVIPTSQLQQ